MCPRCYVTAVSSTIPGPSVLGGAHRKGHTAKSVRPYGWSRKGDVSHSRLCTCRSFLNPSILWYALQTGLWSGSASSAWRRFMSGPCWQSAKLGHTLFCISMQCPRGLTALGEHWLAMRTPHTHAPPTQASNSPSYICGPPVPSPGNVLAMVTHCEAPSFAYSSPLPTDADCWDIRREGCRTCPGCG